MLLENVQNRQNTKHWLNVLLSLSYIQPSYKENSYHWAVYADSVVVEGFEKAGEYNVKLYSVSPGEAYSEPLEVKINPEEPPYITG